MKNEEIKRYYKAFMTHKAASEEVDIPTNDVLNAVRNRGEGQKGGGNDGTKEDS